MQIRLDATIEGECVFSYAGERENVLVRMEESTNTEIARLLREAADYLSSLSYISSTESQSVKHAKET